MEQGHLWPEGVPQNFDVMVREYGPYVEKQVKRYNKKDMWLEDLTAHIWLKLIESDLLEKFVARANTTLPPTMTATQAVAFLGITLNQWGNIVWTGLREDYATAKSNGKGVQKRTRLDWLPKPISGTPYSKKAVFRGVDIKLLHESGFIKKRHFSSVRPDVTGRGFKSYLQRAIRNHFANWCRTHSRRHKERPLTADTVLATNADGTFRTAAHIEGNSSWEATLVSASFSDSEQAEVLSFARVARQHFDVEAIGETLKDGKTPTRKARKSLEVLDFVSQGYSIKEAVLAQAKAAARQRVRQRVTQMA